MVSPIAFAMLHCWIAFSMISPTEFAAAMAEMMAPASAAIVVRSAAPWCGAATIMAARRSVALANNVKCGYFLANISCFPFLCSFEFVF